MARSSRRLLLLSAGTAVLLAGLGYAVYTNRWSIGRRAVEIADPAVRRWATREALRLSDGVYQLTASTIRVDEARRRVAIDTVIVITDAAANGRRKVPLPSVTLRFRNCALEGIDLDRLAARRGLEIARVGCDTVALIGEVPAGGGGTAPGERRTSFLTLRDNLDLPREIPFIRIDTVAFPHVRLALGIAGRSGRRTALAFDRLGVRLDSLHYDPRQDVEERGTLLSRDATLRLDGFEGSREAANRLAFRHLSASLARGSFQLDSFVYEPLPGDLADSLGFTSLAVRHLEMTGIDWRDFLTTGDVGVGVLRLDSADIRMPRTRPKGRASPIERAPRTLGTILRALDRSFRVDSLALAGVRITEEGGAGESDLVTRVGMLHLAGAAFDDSASWTSAFPIGKVRAVARDVSRHGDGNLFALDSLRVDMVAQRVSANGLRVGPEGSDADFVRRRRWRGDRIELRASATEIYGADLPFYLDRGAYAIRSAHLDGVTLDVYTDKRLPPAPGRRDPKRTPQAFFRDLGLTLRADTIAIAGRATYRERGKDSPQPGVMRFDQLSARLFNVSTDPARQSDSTPLVVLAEARLMGRAPLTLRLELPLLAPDFRMRYRGTLGRMEADAFNPFIVDATGIRFTRGTIEGIRFAAEVRGGTARGSVAPRWVGLGVELPGLARKNTGLLGGLKRAIAKVAANAFVIRDDNTTSLPKAAAPLDGTIRHTWTPRETFPQFLWYGLREALLPLLKL